MNEIQNITCPKCGAEFPLSEAVSHRLREELAAQFESRLATERGELLVAASREARENVAVELGDLQARLQVQQSKLQQAQVAELELRKQKRELAAAQESLKLEVARQLDAERAGIADTVRQQTIAAERLKHAEKELLIKGLQEQIAALKQRAEQGSVQLQGESLEVTLEEDLRRTFPYDEIIAIKNGERGADVLQRVRTNAGMECGTILWEAKRARNWSASWMDKLKDDQRGAKAELAVLVLTGLPGGVRGIGQMDGVWVCEPLFACALGGALRQGLISTAVQRSHESGRADKMARLYNFLCGVEFRQHVEAVVESFVALQEQLSAEQRAFARQWKERAEHLARALQHTAMLYGSIQGIAGRESLPEIQSLRLPGHEMRGLPESGTEGGKVGEPVSGPENQSLLTSAATSKT